MTSFYPDNPQNDPPLPRGGASELMGGSGGLSLDGQSLILNHDDNTISSINTDYHSKQMRAMGMDPEITGLQESPSPRNASSRQEMDEKYNQHAYPKKPQSRSTKNPTATDDDDYYDNEEDSCLPAWITDAPFWLKMLVVTSVALLVGAMLLIGVAASIDLQNDEQANSKKAAPTPPPANLLPTQSDSFGDFTPGEAPTAPTESPVAVIQPWQPRNTSTSVSFFVAGGRFEGATLAALPEELQSLPDIDGNTVLFHLGDWNSPFETDCDELSFEDNANLFEQSSLPVYFVVGDNEFNDCPDPRQAYRFWYDYLLDFETAHWPAPEQWNITRDSDYSENFAYVHRNVLIVGINLVGGVVHDNKEWEDRHDADLRWIELNYNAYEGEFETMVIIAHADPEIQANEPFFDVFYELVRSDFAGTQIIFIHRSLGDEGWALEPNYNGIENLMVAVVEGTLWPPMLVTIDTAAGLVEIDQKQWYQQFKAGGMI